MNKDKSDIRLKNIKPVRLEHDLARVTRGWRSHKIGAWEAMSELKGKINFLCDYPDLLNTLIFCRNISIYINDIFNSYRYMAWEYRLGTSPSDEAKETFCRLKEEYYSKKEAFLDNVSNLCLAKEIAEMAFIFHDQVLYYMLIFLLEMHNDYSYDKTRISTRNFANEGFITECLHPKANAPFIIVCDERTDDFDFSIIKVILEQAGKRFFYISKPYSFEVDGPKEWEDTINISMDNQESAGNGTIIHPIELIHEGESLGDNRDYLIDYLLRKELKGECAVLFSSGMMFDDLSSQQLLKKSVERLTLFVSPVLESQMAFGWAGDYLSYISQVHDIYAAKLLASPAEYGYSIIVPARNSAATLRYTLMSCLNQRYQGDYEIVLSDNSTPGNTEVFQLYKELNDPKIKYYRTPREYNLSRSFEFAFLHARGEFLLSLGSDDALLPWTLEVLDELRKSYPDEDVIQWERGFYAWPGFNGGQQHQFVIPRDYQKGVFCPEYFTRQFYFGSIFNNSDQMYLLPNLYLNSGCRRDYLKTILAKTGRLFDGICQDIYMGVVNAAINDKILNIRYPLTIAGMSGGSMGAKANMVYDLKEDETEFLNDLKKTANIGGYCASPYERMMPEVTTDKSSLYNCILRMIARGVIAESDLEYFDFRGWFLDVFRQMDIRDPLFDKKVHYFRYTASLHGEEFLKWFDENIYHKALIPRELDEEKLAGIRRKKCYKEGTDSYGGQTFDASKYGAYNVYDASILFEKISGL